MTAMDVNPAQVTPWYYGTWVHISAPAGA